MNASAEADGAPSPAGEGGLGARLNRLMQAAETEAAQVREAAEGRAAALLTEAHAEIARHGQDRRRERQEPLAAAEERVAVELTEAGSALAAEQAPRLRQLASICRKSFRRRVAAPRSASNDPDSWQGMHRPGDITVAYARTAHGSVLDPRRGTAVAGRGR
jgi:hypothetical protein